MFHFCDANVTAPQMQHNFEASLLSEIKKLYSSLEIYMTNVISEFVACDL